MVIYVGGMVGMVLGAGVRGLLESSGISWAGTEGNGDTVWFLCGGLVGVAAGAWLAIACVRSHRPPN